TVFADVVDLDADLRDGLIRGAQSVIGIQGKIAAVEGRRVDDRYNVLSKAVYSPCEVCEENPTPLWRIRARKIIHDEEARQIHYENAWFDVLGLPIFWTPYFRHPDPTVDRASGFLTPSFKQSTNYGYGLQVPYYWVIDDQTDVTITPFFLTEEGAIGSLEFRRAFRSGQLSFGGSITRSDFDGESGFEGHLDTEGLFTLESGTNLGWDVRITSDDSYLRFFDFSNEDRLESEAFVYNYGPDGYFEANLVYFQSLRDAEPAGTIPIALPDFEARYELPEPVTGGEIGLFVDSQALIRRSDFEPAAAGLVTGSDTARFSIGADWEKQITLPIGLQLTGFGEVRGDLFVTRDLPGANDHTRVRLAPLVGVEARYPLIWEQGDGVAHILEPIAQAIAAPYGGNSPGFTNEDSQVIEFDETNLFDRSRFSGLDAVEEGPRFNLGLRYERLSTDGIKIDGAIGRVLRLRDADEFTTGSGLTDQESDWVTSWSVAYPPFVTFRQRLRFDDDFSVNRNEISLVAEYDRVDFAATYVFLESDPLINQPTDREEFSLLTGIELTPNWRVRGFLQRDLELDEFVELGGGLTYANECCEIDLFVRRRFTDQDDVPASTSVGVQVKLLTLGTSDTGLFGINRRGDPVTTTETAGRDR
ncbi:MAG: LPS assembly protein LptD, partial [Pseudomonadota bacterium]